MHVSVWKINLAFCGSPLSIQTYLWETAQILMSNPVAGSRINSYTCLNLSKGEVWWQLREQKRELPARTGCQGTAGCSKLLLLRILSHISPLHSPAALCLAPAPLFYHPRNMHRDSLITSGVTL